MDDSRDNRPREVKGAVFSRVRPEPVASPKLVAASTDALSSLLGLTPSEVDREDFVQYFSGNKLIPGSDPAAHCYCGYQFGSFAGQLGDGAAMYLGEVLVPPTHTLSRKGDPQQQQQQQQRWEVQFKGSGPTPYSRTAGKTNMKRKKKDETCAAGTDQTHNNHIYTQNTSMHLPYIFTLIQMVGRCSVAPFASSWLVSLCTGWGK